MRRIGILAFALCATLSQLATAQQPNVLSNSLSVNSAESDFGDLKTLKDGKWEVVKVERDGDTVPAQFGQQPGDVISFNTKNGLTVFG